MKRIKRLLISEKVQMILLFVSVLVMMLMFAVTVWDDLFHKDHETIRQEQEREARRIERMEMLKDIK
ncbi:hypothetical protein BW899_06655 [Bacillus mycoides]|nr:hypothetical protein BW899_06655 [Bacillus mycoides]